MEIAKYILMFLGGLGALLIGMKIFSETIEKMCGKFLTKLFDKTTKNKFMGVGIGCLTTAMIQSSGATTVMVVGLANSGILPLAAATSIIIGANIGTTITAQIAAISTLGQSALSVGVVCMSVTCIGMFMQMIAKSRKWKDIGYAIASFGLIFLGLEIMSLSIGKVSLNDSLEVISGSGLLGVNLGGNDYVYYYVQNVFNSVSNPFLLLLIGILLTAAMQSSSALTTVLVSMVTAGLVVGGGGDGVIYVLLGSNIGSCVTALISSIGTSVNAKRASMIHLLFNVGGAIIFMIMLLIWNLSGHSFMETTFGTWFSFSPALQVSMFHTFFNVVACIIFLPFTKYLEKLACLLIRDKKNETPKTSHLVCTDKRLLRANPSLTLSQLRKETMNFAKLSMDTLQVALDDFLNNSKEHSSEVAKKIDEQNEYSNEILSLLTRLSSVSELSKSDAHDLTSLHHAISDVLRISEVSDNVLKYTQKQVDKDLHFSQGVDDQIRDMFSKIEALFDATNVCYIDKNKNLLPKIDKLEDEIDAYRSTLLNQHIERLTKGLCQYDNISIFVNLISNLERVGDHLHYIAHTIDEGE